MSWNSSPSAARGGPAVSTSAKSLPKIGLARGALGAVVMVFTRPRPAYDVEFVGENGERRALATLSPKQISLPEPVG